MDRNGKLSKIIFIEMETKKMGLWLRKMESKYGKYAIHNITLYLICCYAAGYVISLVNSDFFNFLTLNPYLILHGQIWRLFTWIIIPPDSLDIFTLIMLYFYYSIGNTLERTWGCFTYNFYLLLGMVLTIIGAFVFFGICAFSLSGPTLMAVMQVCCQSFSTYYVCMSIILAFAMTFPDVQVFFMFLIPLKIKVLGIVYVVFLGWQVLADILQILTVKDSLGKFYYSLSDIFAIVFSLLNFVIFFIGTRKSFRTPKQVKRQREYTKKVVRPAQRVTKHKCAICGRTDEEYPELTFRFCSKCDGNYEYCSDHLFSHKHVGSN